MGKKSKVRQARFGGWIAYGFFGIFAVAGLVTFYFLTWRPLTSILAARSWEETSCVIVSSDVAVNHGSDSTTYRVDIRYTYEAERGETFHGDRYDFSIGSSSGYDAKAAVVEAHPPGREVTCYVDPQDPSRAVINRSAGTFLLWGLFPLPFLAVGLGGLLFLATASGKRSPGKASKRGRGRPAAEPTHVGRRRSASSTFSGQVELEAEASPAVKLIGTGCAALFWNGIVSVFLFAVIIPSFRREDPEWFATIFMTPFVLVGLGLIGAVLYQSLASFNPRPRLTLTDRHLTPGNECSLHWQFSGRADRIAKLTIELEGREEARYRRGTSTTTDHRVFFSRELVSQGGRFSSVGRGSTNLDIPRRTMPTFEAPNNKIEWRLKVHGDISFWPDVNETFPIVVYPGRDGRS